MRSIPEPVIRFCDVVLKALVVMPLSAFLLYVLSEIRTLREFPSLFGSVDESMIFLLLLFTIGYGAWSALAVYRRRRKAQNSFFWALAAFWIWMVAIPGFAGGIRRRAEYQGRNNLQLIHSALSRHHGKARAYPASLEALTVGGYLVEIPNTRLPNYHADTSRVTIGKTPDDSAGWLYDPALGRVLVNCTHTDSKGTAWSGY